MSVKERFCKYLKKIFFFILSIFILKFNVSHADEKLKIINNIKNIETLKFDFSQKTEKRNDIGTCNLSFPGKLKCDYKDNKQSVLIINGGKLFIYQKRYKKKYFYPIEKSIFVNILNKNQLINLIRKSKLTYVDDIIHISSMRESNHKIILLFNKRDFTLIGWETLDQFNKKTMDNLLWKVLKNVL